MSMKQLDPSVTYFLHPETVFHRPEDLQGQNHSFKINDNEFVISCPHTRARSKVISERIRVLLLQFREGSKVTPAVLHLANAFSLDPKDVMSSYLPILQDLFLWKYLCSANEINPDPKFSEGWEYQDYKIQRLIKKGDSSNIYIAKNSELQTVCIKRVQCNDDFTEWKKLKSEVSILSGLAGLNVPKLLSSEFGDKESIMVTSWVGDFSAKQVFEGEIGAGYLIDTRTSLKTAVGILETFSGIHEKGVLHSDIHYNNIRFNDQGHCSVIDFGLSFKKSTDELNRPLTEAVAHFLAPEQLPQKEGGNYYRPDYSSEQYSLAAVLFLLLTGEHYQDFRLEYHEMALQIRKGVPRKLILRNGSFVIGLQKIFDRALAKNPGDRYASLYDFIEDFNGVITALSSSCKTSQSKSLPTIPCLALLTPEIAIRTHANDFDIADSLNLALSAIALSQVRQDPFLLEAADIWGCRARERANDKLILRRELKAASKQPIPKFVGGVCLHEIPSIITIALALIEYQCHGRVPDGEIIIAAIRSEFKEVTRLDLTSGKSAYINALAELAQIGGLEENVLGFGRTIVHDTLSLLENVKNEENVNFGMAHGASGVLFAILRWTRATNSVPDERLYDMTINILSRLSEGELKMYFPPSALLWWCNGLSGLICLLELVSKVFPAINLQNLLEQATNTLDKQETSITHICCGEGGRCLGLWKVAGLTGKGVTETCGKN